MVSMSSISALNVVDRVGPSTKLELAVLSARCAVTANWSLNNSKLSPEILLSMLPARLFGGCAPAEVVQSNAFSCVNVVRGSDSLQPMTGMLIIKASNKRTSLSSAELDS